MDSDSNPETFLSPDTAEPRKGNGTFDNGWKPGDPDNNSTDVREKSTDADHPGIVKPETPLIG